MLKVIAINRSKVASECNQRNCNLQLATAAAHLTRRCGNCGIHSFPQRNEKCVLSQWPTEAAAAAAATATAATAANGGGGGSSSNNKANNGAANAHKSKVNCFLPTHTHTVAHWHIEYLQLCERVEKKERERAKCLVFCCLVSPCLWLWLSLALAVDFCRSRSACLLEWFVNPPKQHPPYPSSSSSSQRALKEPKQPTTYESSPALSTCSHSASPPLPHIAAACRTNRFLKCSTFA